MLVGAARTQTMQQHASYHRRRDPINSNRVLLRSIVPLNCLENQIQGASCHSIPGSKVPSTRQACRCRVRVLDWIYGRRRKRREVERDMHACAGVRDAWLRPAGDDISARGACVTSGRAPQERMRIGMHVRLTYGTRRVGRPAAIRLRAGRQPRWGWAHGTQLRKRIGGQTHSRKGQAWCPAVVGHSRLAGYGWRRRSAGPAGASDAVCVCWTIGGASDPGNTSAVDRSHNSKSKDFQRS
jgi:hypothetical protein